MGVLRPRFSEEEKEEIKQIIEEGLLKIEVAQVLQQI